MKTRSLPLMIALVLAAALALTACSPRATETAPASTPAPEETLPADSAPAGGYPAAGADAAGGAAYPAPGAGGVLFILTQPDGSAVEVRGDVFDGLTAETADLDGRTVSGYRLSDILSKLGVGEYAVATVDGADSSLVLSKAQVDEQILLELSGDPAVAGLVSASLPAEQWVRGITGITLE